VTGISGPERARSSGDPHIDPALGLPLVPHRELRTRQGTVSICIPAHNEAETIVEVVQDAFRALDILAVDGEVIVCASACTDDTAARAKHAGAHVVEAGIGKGVAVRAGLRAAEGQIVATVDGDFRYFGPEPVAATLVRPILTGSLDATVADLYWRPLYPQLWFYGFFAPLAGRLFPELLGKVGTTPWSGQRAALRPMWDVELPDDFTIEMSLNLAWNDIAARVRPVPVDDWVNPQRPKPYLPRAEFELMLTHAQHVGRLKDDGVEQLRIWFRAVQERMATYRHDDDDPTAFEHDLLLFAMEQLPPTA
jgi:glycosyltransferase involved in cell wall biosynthesis